MVHALKQIERVVRPGGLLVDLRPLLDRWPIEVAWSEGQEQAGRSTDLREPLSDDAAANAAMEQLTHAGTFAREEAQEFPLFYYWNTPKEMEEYLAEEWSDVISVDDSVWSRLRSLWATANPEARVRLRMKMLVTRYRKL